MSVAAVVLAAGASTRLGSAKQLVRLGGETLLERAVKVAFNAGCLPVVVVLGASADVVLAASNLDEALVEVNEDWASGMGGSIRVGVEAVENTAEGVVVMTCDQPSVSAVHLRTLIDEGSAGEIVASGYGGRRGVPAYFPAAWFGELRKLRGDVGARALLAGVRVVELAGGDLDVDTAADLRRVRELMG